MTSEDTVAEQLRTIVRLLTLLVTRGISQRDQIIVLSGAGFQPREIADLIGTTPNTVSVTLSTAKKEGKRRKPKTREGSTT